MAPDDHAALLAEFAHRDAMLQRDMAEVSQQSEALRLQIARSNQSTAHTLAASRRVLAEAYAAMAKYPRIV